MKTGHILFSALHVFVIVFLFSIAAACFAISFSPSFRLTIMHYLVNNHALTVNIGYGFLVAAMCVYTAAYIVHRRQYIRWEFPRGVVSLDEDVICSLTNSYFKKEFPGFNEDLDIVIHNHKKIEVITSLSMLKNSQDLSHIQQGLSRYLYKHFEYTHPLILTFFES